MIDYKKYDKAINKDELDEQLSKAAENSFEEIPEGTYEVALEQMEMKETKDNTKLMVTIRYSIQKGRYKGQKIFQNMVVSGTSNDGFVIHRCMQTLKALGVDEEECHFTTYSALAELVEDLSNDFKGEEYELTLKQDAKGYIQYTIK